MRPGRFELPRPVKVTRPSTLRGSCPSCPTAPESPIPSRIMDDLDFMDGMGVVTVLSWAGLAGVGRLSCDATRGFGDKQ